MTKTAYMRATSKSMAQPAMNTQNLSTDNHPDGSFQLQDFHKLLNAESHIFIVLLGSILGGMIALAIGHSVQASPVNFVMLSLIPIGMSYILRKVYIYTLLNFKD